MAFVSILLRGNSQPGKGKRYAKRDKKCLKGQIVCKFLYQTDWSSLTLIPYNLHYAILRIHKCGEYVRFSKKVTKDR